MLEEQYKNELTEMEETSTVLDEDEIKQSERDLFIRYNEKFSEALKYLKEENCLEMFANDFIEDICNCLSRCYMTDENNRTIITTWFVKTKVGTHQSDDPITLVTEAVLCIWRYET